jgi:dihydroorotate dehydrogenase (NAD+) catalytic subunit
VKVDIRTTIAGIRFGNPVIAASGTFGYGDEIADMVPLKKLGGIITKTITLKARPGNPPPRLAEVRGGMLNTIGLQNVGVDRFLKEKWCALRNLPVPVIVSIAGETADEYVGVARRLQRAGGVQAVELNLSCPNLQKRIVCQDEALVGEIIRGVKKAIRCPVIAKLSPQVADIAALARHAERAGADALSLVNTFPGMAVNIRTWRPMLAVVSGGMSGPAIKPLALKCVWDVCRAVNIPVIGGGGIMDGNDAVEFLLAGASVLSIGTANFVDPLAPVTIAREIEAYLRARKLHTLSDVIGKMKISAPLATKSIYER